MAFTHVNMARILARAAYDDETLEHAERVAAEVQRIDGALLMDVSVALLHDVLEDTRLTWVELATAIGLEIADAVHVLTRREGEPYAAYLQRVISSGNEMALRVKLADARDNLARCRRQPKDDLLRRYEASVQRLEEVLS